MYDLIYTMILSDGTEIRDLRKNGNNYISATELTSDTFYGKLSRVTVKNGNIEDTLENMELVQITNIDDEYWFVLRPLSDIELKMQELENEIRFSSFVIHEIGTILATAKISANLCKKGELVIFTAYSNSFTWPSQYTPGPRYTLYSPASSMFKPSESYKNCIIGMARVTEYTKSKSFVKDWEFPIYYDFEENQFTFNTLVYPTNSSDEISISINFSYFTT